MAVLRRVFVAAALSGAVTAPAAWPAMAATAANPDAQFYRSTVTSIEPATPGLRISVQGGLVRLENRSGQTVIVHGYAGEDYLRITTSAVDVNVNSLSAALNAGRAPTTTKSSPQGAIPRPPVWKRLQDTPVATWHDYRVQWTATQRPPIVVADAHHAHRVFEWAFNVTRNGRPLLVRGAVTWVGTALFSPVQWVAMGATAIVVPALVALAVLRRRRNTDVDPPQSPDLVLEEATVSSCA